MKTSASQRSNDKLIYLALTPAYRYRCWYELWVIISTATLPAWLGSSCSPGASPPACPQTNPLLLHFSNPSFRCTLTLLAILCQALEKLRHLLVPQISPIMQHPRSNNKMHLCNSNINVVLPGKTCYEFFYSILKMIQNILITSTSLLSYILQNTYSTPRME